FFYGEAARLAVLVRGPRTRLVAAGRVLDLDNVRPHVTEQRAAEGPGQHAGEIDNANALQGESHRPLRGGGQSHRGANREARCMGCSGTTTPRSVATASTVCGRRSSLASAIEPPR